MSLLAALTLDLDLTMIPASTMSCRPELLKHRLPHAGHSELLPGPVDQGFALSMERPLLTGDGFSDWMTERTDLATLLSVSGESSPLSLPSPPAPDLEAMASLLKKELEQMEDYFLEESLSPDQMFCHLYLSTASGLLWFLIISDAQESGKASYRTLQRTAFPIPLMVLSKTIGQ